LAGQTSAGNIGSAHRAAQSAQAMPSGLLLPSGIPMPVAAPSAPSAPAAPPAGGTTLGTLRAMAGQAMYNALMPGASSQSRRRSSGPQTQGQTQLPPQQPPGGRGRAIPPVSPGGGFWPGGYTPGSPYGPYGPYGRS